MELTLDINKKNKYISVSDFDNDKDIEITIVDTSDYEDDAQGIYLNKDDLISLKKHIDYLLKKQ